MRDDYMQRKSITLSWERVISFFIPHHSLTSSWLNKCISMHTNCQVLCHFINVYHVHIILLERMTGADIVWYGIVCATFMNWKWNKGSASSIDAMIHVSISGHYVTVCHTDIFTIDMQKEDDKIKRKKHIEIFFLLLFFVLYLPTPFIVYMLFFSSHSFCLFCEIQSIKHSWEKWIVVYNTSSFLVATIAKDIIQNASFLFHLIRIVSHFSQPHIDTATSSRRL